MKVRGRIPVIAAAGAIALIGLAGPAGAQASPQAISGWPQFSGNAAHTGTDTTQTSITSANAGQLAVAWTASLPSPSYNSEVVVSGGAAYVAAGQTLTALDTATGAVLWQRTVRGNVAGTPAVSGGLVLEAVQKTVGTHVPRSVGYVVALRAASGDTAWAVKATGIPSPSLASGDSITVASGLAYLDEGNQIVALHVADGTQAWESAAIPGCSISQPTVSGAYVVVGSGGTDVTALNKADGSVAWTRSFGSGCGFSTQNWMPSVHQDGVDAGLLKGVVGLSLATGHQEFRARTGSAVFFPLSLVSHEVIMATRSGRPEAVSQQGGELLWKDSSSVPFVSDLATFGSLSWGLGQDNGSVQAIALNPANGQVVYTSGSYPDDVQGMPPVVEGGHVYLNLGNEVVCLALPAGR